MIDSRVQVGSAIVRWVLVLFLLSIVAKGLLGVAPVYIEHARIEAAVAEFLSDQTGSGQLAREELLDQLGEHLASKGIHAIDESNFSISRERTGQRWLQGNFSRRVPFLGNVDLVVSFDDMKFDVTDMTVI